MKEGNLVIVESPAKAGTIQKFLGKDFVVKSSFGHIRDLHDKDLSIDVEHGFKPEGCGRVEEGCLPSSDCLAGIR